MGYATWAAPGSDLDYSTPDGANTHDYPFDEKVVGDGRTTHPT